MKNILKGIGMWFLFFLLYILSNALASSLAAADQMPGIPMGMLYVQTAAGLGLLAFLIYFFWTQLKEFKWTVKGLSDNVTIVWWPLLFYVAILVFQFFFPTSSDSINQRAVESFTQNYPVLAFFLVVIFAPIIEEMLFRGLLAQYLFPKIEKTNKAILYMVVSGVLFSFAHTPTQFIHFMIYFTMGVSIAWLYVSKRDLRYPIALHMFNNLLGFLMISMS